VQCASSSAAGAQCCTCCIARALSPRRDTQTQANYSDFFTSGDRAHLAAVFDTFPLHDIWLWLTRPEDTGGLGLHLLLEEETQKYFPASNSAREVRDRLLHACQRQGVDVRVRSSVESMHRSAGGDSWICTLAGGQIIACDAAVVAAGGLSYPAVGTDGTGYRIAQCLGHDMKKAAPYPALVPLAGVHPGGTNSLAGVSIAVGSVRAVSGAASASSIIETRGGFLFSHKGFSGPSVLNASHAVTNPLLQRSSVEVNWSGDSDVEWDSRLCVGGRSSVAAVLAKSLPQRLALALCADAGVDHTTLLMSLSRNARKSLVARLTQYELRVTGSLGWKLAEVTGGGVPLHELHIPTLESRFAAGVYHVGEMVDVFGKIGGFNFTWAWASGHANIFLSCCTLNIHHISVILFMACAGRIAGLSAAQCARTRAPPL
jgi:predicted Rossmann fold flavoprotein